MNLLIVIFLSGLAMKAIVSLIGWVWEGLGNESGRWVNASRQITELGKLAPEQYLSVRVSDPKIRRLSAANAASEKVISIIAPPDKKSA